MLADRIANYAQKTAFTSYLVIRCRCAGVRDQVVDKVGTHRARKSVKRDLLAFDFETLHPLFSVSRCLSLLSLWHFMTYTSAMFRVPSGPVFSLARWQALLSECSAYSR